MRARKGAPLVLSGLLACGSGGSASLLDAGMGTTGSSGGGTTGSSGGGTTGSSGGATTGSSSGGTTGTATKCLEVRPALLDFGTVGSSNGQFCSPAKKKFVAINACTSQATITAVDLTDGGPFFLGDTPSLPAVVPAGGTSDPFVVGFRPTAAGSFEGAITVQTDVGPMPFGVYLNGAAVTGIDLSPDAGSPADGGLICN
jgi:hypothetical protein